MVEFIQHVVNGLGQGAIYALIALGYTMVFGILQLINFAHSDVYMLGAFAGFYSSRLLGFSNRPGIVSLFCALAISMAVCGLVGFCIERFAYRPDLEKRLGPDEGARSEVGEPVGEHAEQPVPVGDADRHAREVARPSSGLREPLERGERLVHA